MTIHDTNRSPGGTATLVLALLALAAAMLTAVLAPSAGAAEPQELTPPADQVSRGEYLVTVTGCGDCHTPMKMGDNGPEPDTARLLSGHPEGLAMPAPPELPAGPWIWVGSGTNTAFAGPWGVSYAPNLTPDPDTGIGIWTEDIFVSALRTGRHWGQSRPILPPMPWPGYSRMTDDDLRAVFAYLRSVPPIHNRAPESEPVPAE